MANIGLTLSGGGARCIAQLGAIAYMEEQGFSFSALSGASGGAIVAGLYAQQKSPSEILSILESIDFKKHFSYNLKYGTLYHLENGLSYFYNRFGKIDIRDLPIPFYCAVTNYESGKVEYKNEGDLVMMMIASSALVPFFAPVEYEGTPYIDGGFCDNLPTKPLLEKCEKIIAINVNPIPKTIRDSFSSHIKRSLFIMLNNNVNYGKVHCDLFVEIAQMGQYSIFDQKNFGLFFEIGYKEMQKQQANLERIA